MERNPENYDTHNQSIHQIPIFDANVEPPEVKFHTYGNNGSFTAQFLNLEYERTISRISPEIYTESRLDGKDEAFTEGTIHIEIHDKHQNILGVRTADIQKLGHSVKPGFAFVPSVKFSRDTDEETHHTQIDSIHIFVDAVKN